jgi:hypothetical protein
MPPAGPGPWQRLAPRGTGCTARAELQSHDTLAPVLQTGQLRPFAPCTASCRWQVPSVPRQIST